MPVPEEVYYWEWSESERMSSVVQDSEEALEHILEEDRPTMSLQDKVRFVNLLQEEKGADHPIAIEYADRLASEQLNNVA